MNKASVRQIFISPVSGGQLIELKQVEAVRFSGLLGDRYLRNHPAGPGNKNAITLIDIQQVEACNIELQRNFCPEDFRRNIITEGADLNSLVGREFYLGAVKLRGVELCQPCKYISEMLAADLLTGLNNRGGLRAEIIEGGLIKAGDSLKW